jgi:hypothetical protein
MKTLLQRGNDIIQARNEWEQKQALYYQMRHDGLRRTNKPFPGAADLHFPLIDMNISKGKPFWMAQATSSERLASFVALQEQDKSWTVAAADFFDFTLKQKTQYYQQLFRKIDTMCLRGKGVMKWTVDPFRNYELVPTSIDPVNILMPREADDFDDADEFIHVQGHTVPSYKRNRRYNQDPDIIKQISGRAEDDESQTQDEEKQMHEGVNHTTDSNKIILWEHWVKTINGWTIHTYSPMKPDLQIRAPYKCPYKGLDGKPSQPFFSFEMEIKDAGWYSTRGMGEKGAPFEAYACKLWNEKTDAMTYANRPVFTSEKQIDNTANIRWAPGELIPGNIRSVVVAPPAFSFDQEIAFTRSTSEQQNMLPDFGIVQPGQPGQPSNPRTATENNRISNLQSVGTEASGMIYRMKLAKMYRHVWALMLQFKKQDLLYYAGKELKSLPEQAMHEAYLIMPDGSPDNWNKDQRLQKAYARRAAFKGDQNCDQDVLARDTMAADDPKFALEAFIPSNLAAANQAEDEAMEIVILSDGFPAVVMPNEDHVTRIHVLMSWLQKQAMAGAPLNPVAKQRILEHMGMHFQILHQQNPQAAKQVEQQLQQMEQQSMQPQAPGPGAGPMNSQSQIANSQAGEMPPDVNNPS